MRAVNGPCTSSPCTVLSVRARNRLAKTPPISPCLQRKPSCTPLTYSHSIFMHTCTIYVCTLHTASALNSALCVSSGAYVMYNLYVSESLTAGLHACSSVSAVAIHGVCQNSIGQVMNVFRLLHGSYLTVPFSSLQHGRLFHPGHTTINIRSSLHRSAITQTELKG